MQWRLSVPSKTFLLGEYLALQGGPTLLLNTHPRFNLLVSEKKFSELSTKEIFLRDSPAQKYLHKHQDFFKQFNLEFSDPYHGMGGLGASSAQFILLMAFRAFHLSQALTWQQLLDEYQTYAWDGKGYKPSGADVVAQLQGGLTYFDRKEEIVNKFIWPFQDYEFALIYTGNKINTHEYLKTHIEFSSDGMQEIVLAAKTALLMSDINLFIATIQAYTKKLYSNKLVAPTSQALLTLIAKNPNILAAKGCGALGADVIFVLFKKNTKDQLLSWANKNNIKLVSNPIADEGLSIEVENKEKNIQVILVNEQDQQIGVEEKIRAHREAKLHRAFSIFIFRKNAEDIELLLQQRATEKYHGGGLWTNTCCSHPAPGEDILQAAKSRLFEEFGITAQLQKVSSFIYLAKLDKDLYEHEYDHVFVGKYENDPIKPDAREISAYEWISLKKLIPDLEKSPQKYSPWLAQALSLILKANILEKLLKK